jgi:2-hydroxy-3-oxopropionate reductase
MSKVGFIGLGIMGKPMAGQLIKGGLQVYLFSRSGVPAALVDAGGTACASAREVGQQADIIITMVPDTPHVQAVQLPLSQHINASAVPGRDCRNESRTGHPVPARCGH